MSDDNKHLIAYCGLYCGDCHFHTGKIPDLARALRKELKACRYDIFAEFIVDEGLGKVFKNYNTCYEVLGAMVMVRCKKGCKNGGGPPSCAIRKSCQEKGIEGCWECNDFETCEKLSFLNPVHGDAHIMNLRKIKKQGVEAFLTGERYWYTPRTT